MPGSSTCSPTDGRMQSWRGNVSRSSADLRSPRRPVGNRPVMLDSYRPNVGMNAGAKTRATSCRPALHRPGRDLRDEDNASADAGSSAASTTSAGRTRDDQSTDWVQIKDTLKRRRPNLQTAEFPANVVTNIFMRTDKARSATFACARPCPWH